MTYDITHEELVKLLDYDPETGVFVWKTNTNPKRPLLGRIAGCKDKLGYVMIGLRGKSMQAHRLAWFYVYKTWPAKHLDHIDRNPSNNTISNLRECTSAQNQYNASMQKNNQTGLKGVSFHKKYNKWYGGITIDGRYRFLGSFDCPAAAHLAYVVAANKHAGEFFCAGERT